MKTLTYVTVAALAIGGLLLLWPHQSEGGQPLGTASCVAVPSPVLNTYAYQVSFYAESNAGGGIYQVATNLLSTTGVDLGGSTHTYEGPPYPKAVGATETLLLTNIAGTYTVSIQDKNQNEKAIVSVACA